MNLSNDIFKQLLDLSDSGLFAFVEPSKRLVYICHGKNLLSSLNQHIERFRLGAHECRDLQRDFVGLEVVFLETEEDSVIRKLKAEIWKREYISRGYKLYKQKTAIKLDISTRIETEGELPYKVLVCLSTKRGDSRIVGIFNTIKESKEFILINYPSPNIQAIIYATNKLTLDYLQKKVQY